MNSYRRISTLAIISMVSLSLAASACQFEAQVSVDGESDAQVQIVVAIDDFFVNLIPGSADPIAELIDAFEDQIADYEGPFDNATIERYEQSGLFGVRVTAPFDPAIFSILDIFGSDSPFGVISDATPIGEYEFDRTPEDDGWVFIVDQPLSLDPFEELGEMFEGAELGGFNIPTPELTFRLDLPGEILEHNADRLDGDVLVWDIDLSQNISISAVSRDAREFPSIASIAIAAVFILVLIGIAVTVAVSRRRGGTSISAETPEAADA